MLGDLPALVFSSTEPFCRQTVSDPLHGKSGESLCVGGHVHVMGIGTEIGTKKWDFAVINLTLWFMGLLKTITQGSAFQGSTAKVTQRPLQLE